MNKYILSILILTSSYTLFGQFESAMQLGTQMSLNTLQGTARFVGTGGVMGSVGGDISNLSTNPAGLGMFSRSEFEFTPTLSFNNVNSNFLYLEGTNKQSTNWENNRIKFTINSLGVVIANRKSETDVLRASNVVIGINRTADFNRTVDFGVSQNSVYSYSNYLADVATYFNNNVSSFPTMGTFPTANDYFSLDNSYNRVLMARNSQLIFPNTAGNYYVDPTPFLSNSLNVRQFGQQKTSGGVTELSFAWAGNFKDRFYIGASLGIPFLNYTSEFILSEDNNGVTATNPSNFYGNYRYMDLAETDKFTGAGVNLKIGGLVKLTDELKASAYIHSPTFYEITNSYAVGITANYQNSNNVKQQAVNDFNFKYFTPFKFGGGLSYLIGKSGFIGVEYEFTNLDNLTIDFEDDAQAKSYVNNVLRNQNQDLHTLRIGGEYVIPNFQYSGQGSKQSPFRLRAGFNYRTSPTDNKFVEQRGDQVSYTYSGGVGYRGKSVSFDLTYMKTQYRDYDYLYGYEGNNRKFDFGVTSWNSINQIMATLNFRFK